MIEPSNRTEPTNDIAVLADWIDRSETVEVSFDYAHTQQVAATLGHKSLDVGDPLPPLWHWCFGTDTVATDQLGPDGHPPRGGFMPPVALPRRMWAGGRVTFGEPLAVGERVTRTSTIRSVRAKEGSSGPLIFVTVSRIYLRGGEMVIDDEIDLVYRDAPQPLTDAASAAPSKPAPAASRWQRRVVPSETLLFRYSAVTFNSHRIHYDFPYATTVEGYEGLVVHGPLTATMLAGLAVDSTEENLRTFSYRGQTPLIAPEPFALHAEPVDRDESGHRVDLWAASSSGNLAMTATATLTQ